jgi:hypothetical protein
MLRFIASLFLAFSAIASTVSAGTFGECSCKFKDGHVQKFQVSDCKASACYIECRQNAGGVQESCVTKNEDIIKLPGPGICQCGKGRYAVSSCDSDECFNYCDKPNLGHGVCVTKNALAMALAPATVAAISCDACFAKLADLPADDQAKICTKVLKCVPATVAPTPMAPLAFSEDTAVIPCDKCIAKFADDIPADDAQFVCTKVLKCKPAPTAAPQAMAVIVAISCDKCIAKFADDIPADDAQFVCTKVLKCKPVPTVAQVMSELAAMPCDKCQAELVQKNVQADDAAFMCRKVIECKTVQVMAGGDGANLG